MKKNLHHLPGIAGAIILASTLVACDSDSNIAIVSDTDTSSDVGDTIAENADAGGETGDTSTGTGGNDGAEATDDTTAEPADATDTGDVADAGTDETVDTETGQTDSPVVVPAPNADFEARYRATFNATWSVETAPTNFPADPHFSPLTGAVHNEQVIFWQPGDLASPGIEQMAETGGTTILLSEIDFASSEGQVLSSIEGFGIHTSPGGTSIEFTVNRDFPLVTLVSMLAPSPDWFVGIHGFNVIDDSNNFIDIVNIEMSLYDSGTDSGLQYESPDRDSEVPQAILLTNSFPVDSNFFNGNPSVGTLSLQRLQ